jgi:ABC-2 type transport system permease protein
MNARRLAATVRRVFQQLGHDHRTVALIFVVPCVLETLLRFVYDGNRGMYDQVGGILLGIFPFTIMFIITSITTLRERTSGTLERLLTTPISKAEFVFGYGIAFSILAALQAVVVSLLSFGLLGLHLQGAKLPVILMAVFNALLGTAFGLFLSAFARTEFQAVQFMPAFVFPQMLLAGLIVERARMATVLQWVADVLPLTYASDALKRAMGGQSLNGTFWADIYILLLFIVGALALGAVSLRRSSK